MLQAQIRCYQSSSADYHSTCCIIHNFLSAWHRTTEHTRASVRLVLHALVQAATLLTGLSALSRDVFCLKDRIWLNDEITNAVVELLAQNSGRSVRGDTALCLTEHQHLCLLHESLGNENLCYCSKWIPQVTVVFVATNVQFD